MFVFKNLIKDGEFRTYGIEVASMMEEDPENRIDPMSRIFPRVTKCIFTKFGPGGGIIRRDALCVLPVNIINEVSRVYILHRVLERLVSFSSPFFCRKSMSSFGFGF